MFANFQIPLFDIFLHFQFTTLRWAGFRRDVRSLAVHGAPGRMFGTWQSTEPRSSRKWWLLLYRQAEFKRHLALAFFFRVFIGLEFWRPQFFHKFAQGFGVQSCSAQSFGDPSFGPGCWCPESWCPEFCCPEFRSRFGMVQSFGAQSFGQEFWWPEF